jgi:hypothetical protein
LDPEFAVMRLSLGSLADLEDRFTAWRVFPAVL